MRRISFALTTERILDQSKTVTRRLGWNHLKIGERLQAVNKLRTRAAQKLAVIEVVSVRKERLASLTDDLDYGFAETRAEGYAEGPKSWPSEFVRFFCDSMKCTPDTTVNRIEFRYVDVLKGE